MIYNEMKQKNKVMYNHYEDYLLICVISVSVETSYRHWDLWEMHYVHCLKFIKSIIVRYSGLRGKPLYASKFGFKTPRVYHLQMKVFQLQNS